jgi:endo-1,3-1,4-beta-glycanase ExoK
VHTLNPSITADLCGSYHTYAYEWTPEYIAWFLDGTEIRRETGDAVTAYAENATAGMQFRFNTWPGDATFGGVFDPSILPVYQTIDWVQYSTYASGSFQLAWREEFTANSLPAGWAVGSWGSPKNLSTHSPANVTFVDGIATLALTADAVSGTGGTSSGAGGAAAGAAGADAQQTGGSTSAAGAAGTAGGDEGCSCRTGAASPPYARGAMFLLGAILIGWSRRQRKERPQGRFP